MATLSIISPGVQSLVQDLGRPGLGAMGVPCGGAADRVSLIAANRLVGNVDAAAAIEMAMVGCAAEFDADTVVCIGGASADVALTGPAGESRPIQRWTPTVVHVGERLIVRSIRPGLRAYLCIAGGVHVPQVLGSAATLVTCGIGGFEGRALRAADRLTVGHSGAATPRSATQAAASWLEATLFPRVIRVVPTPKQQGVGAQQALEALLMAPLKVSLQSDRVGVRLEPDDSTRHALQHVSCGRLPSEGTAHGAIEVPPDRRPIVLGVDHPVTGGYAVVACVIAADLSALGQLAPGQPVRFQCVSREVARSEYHAMEARLDREIPKR